MNDLQVIDYEKKAMEYLATLNIGKGLSEGQKKAFLEVASAMKLNPFLKEIYPIPYTNKSTGEVTLTLITSYQIYIARAMATGVLNGWKAWTEGNVEFKQSMDKWGKQVKVVDREKSSLVAKLIIHRKDWDYPYEHECSIKEFCGDSQWNIMPEFMLKKVVIGQGFRLCFPTELSGLPYTQEEVSTFMPDPEKEVKVDQKKDVKVEQTKPVINIEDSLNEIGLRSFGSAQERELMIEAVYGAKTQKEIDVIHGQIVSRPLISEMNKKKQIEKQPIVIDIPSNEVPENVQIVEVIENIDEINAEIETIKKGIAVLKQKDIDKFGSGSASRVKNSIKQHLGVEKLEDCKDLEKLRSYTQWLRDKYTNWKEEQKGVKDESNTTTAE